MALYLSHGCGDGFVSFVGARAAPAVWTAGIIAAMIMQASAQIATESIALSTTPGTSASWRLSKLQAGPSNYYFLIIIPK